MKGASTDDVCNGHGVYNTKKEVCDCKKGFYKKDCSVNEKCKH